jgi:hypothetical protein
MNILISLLTNIGFTVNWDKCVAPSRQLCFLGIHLDSVSGTMSIPQSKLHEIRQTSSTWNMKQKATKREIQSLIGKISWISRCVKAIRPVLRSLIDLQKRLKHSSHHIRIPQYVKADIRYFLQWCAHFNGVVFFPWDKKPRPDTTVYTDSTLTAGAAFCNGDFLYSNWAADMPNIRSEPIFVKELCAVLLAYRRWCRQWTNKTVHVHTDNKGVEWSLRRGLTRNVTANCILKEILWLSAYCNITLVVHYINTRDNYLADLLSGLDNNLMRVASILSCMGVFILSPFYNILYHMSPNTYMSLFSCYSGRGASAGHEGTTLQATGILR